MADRITLIAFLAALVGCVVTGVSPIVPLLVGFILFFARGLMKGISWRTLARASARGVWQSRWVMVVLLLIGAMTALWRGCGAIAFMVNALMPLFSPYSVLLLSFGLCALVSFLMGTAFGTAATAGCACMVIAQACGADLVATAGAVLAGSYFGDRCSPVSSSALLVAQLTETNNLSNILPMLKSAAVPTVLSAVAYGVLGFLAPGSQDAVASLPYESYFVLDCWTIVPAVSILALALLRLPSIANIAVSAAFAFVICVFEQGAAPADALQWAVFGYAAPAEIASMAGGGVSSMVGAVCIIAIASTYAGLLREAGLMDDVEPAIRRGCERWGTTLMAALISLGTSVISCNQTLAILLNAQLLRDSYRDNQRFMLDLEDTVVVVAPLIPWSIAGLVPLTILGAGAQSIPFAFLLYAVPVWAVARDAFSLHSAKTR